MDKLAIAKYKAWIWATRASPRSARPQRREDLWARNTSPRASDSPCGYGKGNLRTQSPRRKPRRIMKRWAMSSQAEPNYISKAKSWTWSRATLGSCRKALATATKSWKRSRRWKPPPRLRKCTAGTKASQLAERRHTLRRTFWLAPCCREASGVKHTEPAFIEPMQCKSVTALSADDKWTFEIKFDGYRCIAVKRGREVTLFSRNKKVLNKRFPRVVDALASLEGDFALDGELVAFDSQGRPSFQVLQNNMSRDLPLYFYAFDLLNRNGDLLLNFPMNVVASCWKGCLPGPRILCAFRHCCRRHRERFLRRCASSAWKVS